jgi:hypothetical protein
VTSNAGALARDLNYRRKKVLEESHALPGSFSMFRMDPDQPPPGARTHSARYELSHGEATLYRGGGMSRIPVVGGSMIEDTFKLWPLVTSFNEDFFEAQSQQYAGYDARGRDVRTARRVLEEFANRINLFGDDAGGLYGALNYPRLAKRVSGTAFNGSESPTDVLAALFSAANYPSEASQELFKPNRMAASPRVLDYLSQTRLGSVNDTTILGFFLESQKRTGGPSKCESMWELKEPNVPGAGAASGVDGIFFWNDDPLAVSIVNPQGIMMLPPFRMGFSTTTVVAMVVGGVTMHRPGNNLLLLVDAE